MAVFRPAFRAGVEANAAPGFAAVSFVAAGIAAIAFAGVAYFMTPKLVDVRASTSSA
jgi:hypothetical protein